MQTTNIIMRVLLLFLFLGYTVSAQEIFKNIDSLHQLLEAKIPDTTKAIVYQEIAGHYNVTWLDSAYSFAEKGIQFSRTINFERGEWLNLNALGNYYERKTAYDSARIQYARALKIIDRTNDTKGFAIVLNNIAMVDTRQGKFDEALEKYFEALKAEEKLGNTYGIAQAYNNIGVVYYYTKNFDKTTEYLTKALELQEELGNLNGLQDGYTNVGAILDYQKKYDAAIVSYEKAVAISKQLGDKKEEAAQLSNIALSYSQALNFKKAKEYFDNSIALRKELKDYNGISHSYVSYGQFFLQQNNLKEAKKYLEDGVAISRKNKSMITLREGLAGLAEVAEKQNRLKASNAYLYEYIAVKDSVLDDSKAKAIEEFETKYETEKKEKEILEQRALIAEQKNEVNEKNNLIYGGFGLATLMGLMGYLFYNQQRLKNRQLKKEGELKTALAIIETQNKLQEQRLRISRDLHDNIGSQLTFIISSIDNLKFGMKEKTGLVANKLSSISAFATSTIYELRDTIWAMNKNEITLEDLQSRISNFIEKAGLASEGTNFDFNISEEIDAAKTFSSLQGMNIYRIIQEAVNNAIKYAEAKTIDVVIDKNNEAQTDIGLIVKITDDGNGFDVDKVTLSNGINNIKKRARDLKGFAKINTEIGKGTQIKVTI